MNSCSFIRQGQFILESYLPTTLDALFLPSSDAADCPSLKAAAASLVMLIDEVLLARIESGRKSAAIVRKSCVFRSSFSLAAYNSEFSI